jgi:hypothetical protein
MWFRDVFGFDEEGPEQVRQNIQVEGQYMESLVTNTRYQCGTFALRSVAELRRSLPHEFNDGVLRLAAEDVVGDVRDFHCDPAYDGAVIQVASQFNALEMIHPDVTPEMGVDRYESDRTQGPICAIACGAGTVFRNYFFRFDDGHVGQTRERQINCLEDVGSMLGNDTEHLWEMRNGYVLADEEGLRRINRKLAGMTEEERDELRRLLKVGVQRDTEVVSKPGGNIVTQVYCSALPVAYCTAPCEAWEPLARLILEAAYEATFLVAVEQLEHAARPKLFLTLLGCGAFGNRTEWAMDAIQSAAHRYRCLPLDVFIVRYGRNG